MPKNSVDPLPKKKSICFIRQKIIGSYIADFYCDAAKPVVEQDGSQHYTPENVEYEKIRYE